MTDKKVLCASSAYEQKYFLNPEFNKLPEKIKDELKIMCVTFTENVGGILIVEFNENGELRLTTQVNDSDIYYDEIESGLSIGRIQREKEELFSELELFYKIIFGTNGRDN